MRRERDGKEKGRPGLRGSGSVHRGPSPPMRSPTYAAALLHIQFGGHVLGVEIGYDCDGDIS